MSFVCRRLVAFPARFFASVHFNVEVNVPDESETCVETDCAEHQKEHVASEKRVAKELERLQAPRHVTSFHVEEYRVCQNEKTSRTLQPQNKIKTISN